MTTQWSFDARTHCQRGHLLAGDNVRPFPGGKRECRLCVKWRQRNGRVDVRVKCPHGHRYTEATSYIGPDGQRRCQICRAHYAVRSACKASRCRNRQVDGGLCATHLRLCLALNEEYGAYWRMAGYY